MPHNNFETIEAALQHLKDVVNQNHPAETAFLVNQMEKLVAELKSKTAQSTEFQQEVPLFQANSASVTVTSP